MIEYGTRYVVNKTNLHELEVKISDLPVVDDLEDGQVILELEKFAYTANNITYALVGEQIGYWKFFPVAKSGSGLIPCWGFGVVIASKHEDVQVGNRYYGFYPMASHLIARPGRVSKRGFTDDDAHRQALPAIYNQYINCDHDILYRSDLEEYQALFRPLFTTSFLIHDQLVENKFYNSQQIILISASSKTGLGLAHCLKDESVEIIGLTSARNLDFVQDTGYFDHVIAYENIESIPIKESAIVDFAGNHSIELKLQNHLGENLKDVCMVGMVRWEDNKGMPKLPLKPKFFFAPTYYMTRLAELGQETLLKSLALKYNEFIILAGKRLNIRHHTGDDEFVKLHHDLVDGAIVASDGHIVTLKNL